MSYFDRKAVSLALPDQIAMGPATGFAENLSAGFSSMRATELLISEDLMLEEAKKERRAKIEEVTGKPFDEAIAPFLRPLGAIPRGNVFDRREAGAIAQLVATLPPDKAGQILGEDRLPVRAKEIALQRVIEAEDVAARGSGFSAVAGQFIGGAGAQFTDPLVMATLPFGPSVATGLVRAAVVNAALGAGVTALQQPVVQEWRERLGLPHGLDVAAQNVGMAALGGAGLTLGLGAAGKAFGWAFNRLAPREQLAAFDALVPDPTPEQSAARTKLESDIAFAEQNPFVPRQDSIKADATADAEHAGRAEAVAHALETGEALPEFRDAPPDIDTRPDSVAPGAPPEIAPIREPTPLRRRRAPSNRPVDVLTFLNRMGGVKDEGGELRGMDVPGRRWFHGIINNKSGVSQEDAIEALIDAGYLPKPPPDGLARPYSRDDLLDLVSRAMGEKVYAQHAPGTSRQLDEIETKAIEAERKLEARLDEEALAKMESELGPGFKFAPEERGRAIELYDQGLDPYDVVERLAIEDLRAEPEAPTIREEVSHADLGEGTPAARAAVPDAGRRPEQSGAGSGRVSGAALPPAGTEGGGAGGQGREAQVSDGGRGGGQGAARQAELEPRTEAEIEALADPQAAAAQAEIEALAQTFRARIEQDGDFLVVRDGGEGMVPASKLLDDLDAEDSFLREIETCR